MSPGRFRLGLSVSKTGFTMLRWCLNAREVDERRDAGIAKETVECYFLYFFVSLTVTAASVYLEYSSLFSVICLICGGLAGLVLVSCVVWHACY